MENDYIKREDAIKAINGQFMTGILNNIMAIPAADVVPIGEEYECGYTDGQMAERKAIVHCKECKWHDDDEDFCHNPVWGDGHANYMPPITDKDNYCSYGERKEQEHEHID